MNRIQLCVLWVIGIAVSAIIGSTGQKLLSHAASRSETWESGYPITLLAGTAWAYIAPIIIMGGILMVSVKGSKSRKK